MAGGCVQPTSVSILDCNSFIKLQTFVTAVFVCQPNSNGSGARRPRFTRGHGARPASRYRALHAHGPHGPPLRRSSVGVRKMNPLESVTKFRLQQAAAAENRDCNHRLITARPPHVSRVRCRQSPSVPRCRCGHSMQEGSLLAPGSYLAQALRGLACIIFVSCSPEVLWLHD